MGNNAITVDQKNLQRYILRLNRRDRDGLSEEDVAALEQIDLFFSANLQLVSYAGDICELALIPRGDGQPPLAEVTVIRQFHTYRLASDENGHVPHLNR